MRLWRFRGDALSLLTRYSGKYTKCRHDALAKARATLAPTIGHEFNLTEYSGRVLEAIRSQWEPVGRHRDSCWDWAEVVRRHKDPDRLAFAIWENGVSLCGVGLTLSTNIAIELRFLEGDPRPTCKLSGKRIVVALEVSANYAQARGKRELRVRPINSRLESLYVGTFGFARCSPRGEEPYLAKLV
jgi:hypothetical protein